MKSKALRQPTVGKQPSSWTDQRSFFQTESNQVIRTPGRSILHDSARHSLGTRQVTQTSALDDAAHFLVVMYPGVESDRSLGLT